ncbi:hypothetical protein [Halorussus ruber]|uniref:hypothetical protein n=1 Tax=Halorussus ruber TaxID=1126238 RepID=UPI001092A594|nr:hypothetical protein [Halorussus ruber]
MDPTDRLTHNLVAESEAYGYTLTVWGSGAMLIHPFGMPDLGTVFLFVLGALLGFGSLGFIDFDRLLHRDPLTVLVALLNRRQRPLDCETVGEVRMIRFA